MSLKAFHIVFIAFSVALALGFGAWVVNDWAKTGQVGSLILGACSFLGGAALVAYGVWFWRKLKRAKLI